MGKLDGREVCWIRGRVRREIIMKDWLWMSMINRDRGGKFWVRISVMVWWGEISVWGLGVEGEVEVVFGGEVIGWVGEGVVG